MKNTFEIHFSWELTPCNNIISKKNYELMSTGGSVVTNFYITQKNHTHKFVFPFGPARQKRIARHLDIYQETQKNKKERKIFKLVIFLKKTERCIYLFK